MFAGQSRTELGVGNRLLLAEEKLAASTRLVQARNDIELADTSLPLEAWELFDGVANAGGVVRTSPWKWRPARARPTSICV